MYNLKNKTTSCVSIILMFLLLGNAFGGSGVDSVQTNPYSGWTTEFNLADCKLATSGKNPYFILEPGYKLTLQGMEDNDSVILVITVLDDSLKIGQIYTRVVEERESSNGSLIEVSRNYFAFCPENGSIFYFGEDVDIYKNNSIVSHEGGWRAGSDSARAGLMMPGLPLLGSKYFQEIAPGVALDRAEIVRLTETFQTPIMKFEKCLKVEESTPLEPNDLEFKLYAPGVGLIKDGGLRLIQYGYK